MAQALLNSLNINTDSSFIKSDNNSKKVLSDFAKIFDSKTNNVKTNDSKIEYTKTDYKDNNDKNTENITNQQASETEQNNSVQSANSTNNTSFQEETFQTEFDNAVKESIADAVVDLTIIKEDVVQTDDESMDLITEEVEQLINEETEELSNEITDTNITIEEPTMNNELTTLENPTIAIMLHSQIQTNVKNVTSNNNEITDDDNVTLTKSDQNLNNSNVFKQFDETSSKDVTINLPKEDSLKKSEHTKLNKVIDEKIVKDMNVKIAETSDNGNEASTGDLMQRQSPQEQVAKVMIQGEVKFDALQADAIKTTEVKPAEISASRIIEQIAKQLDGMYNNSKLNIVLNPGTLGKVNLHILNSKDGLIAQFTVTTQDAKDILMKGLNGLKDSLLSQGISVDNVSVKLEESAESEYQQDWTEQEGSRGGNKQQGFQKQQKKEEKPFEQMMFELNNNDKV